MMITVSTASTSTAMLASASVLVDFRRTGDWTMKFHQVTGELSRSREQRAVKQVARLGVVMDTPKRRKGEIRRRRSPDQETHMEKAGAHGGELKHLIRAGRTLLRRIEGEARGDG